MRVYHYGNRTLEAYIPSLIRGHNIVKAIQSELGDDVIYHIEETDSEVLFRFNSKDMERLAVYLKPKTNGADRSPYSTKNLSKTKYIIPDEDFIKYKNIVAKIPKESILSLTHSSNSYLKSLTTKKNPLENIKADITLKGLGVKEYIHSIGKWDEYINYLIKELSL